MYHPVKQYFKTAFFWPCDSPWLYNVAKVFIHLQCPLVTTNCDVMLYIIFKFLICALNILAKNKLNCLRWYLTEWLLIYDPVTLIYSRVFFMSSEWYCRRRCLYECTGAQNCIRSLAGSCSRYLSSCNGTDWWIVPKRCSRLGQYLNKYLLLKLPFSPVIWAIITEVSFTYSHLEWSYFKASQLLSVPKLSKCAKSLSSIWLIVPTDIFFNVSY